jgi:hypothetical protein
VRGANIILPKKALKRDKRYQQDKKRVKAFLALARFLTLGNKVRVVLALFCAVPCLCNEVWVCQE